MKQKKDDKLEKWLLLRRRCLQVYKDLEFTERHFCGRKVCSELIETCIQLDDRNREKGYYGDVEQGIITEENAQHIHELLMTLQENAEHRQ